MVASSPIDGPIIDRLIPFHNENNHVQIGYLDSMISRSVYTYIGHISQTHQGEQQVAHFAIFNPFIFAWVCNVHNSQH